MFDGIHFRSTLAKLQQANDQKDLELLKRVFEHVIQKPTGKPRDPKSVPQGLLVMIAECGITLEDYRISSGALSMYDRTSPRRDQFWCRSLLAKAVVTHHLGILKKGHALIHNVQKAIEYILEVVAIATDSAQRAQGYAHIAYNATVLYWRVTRCLQRDGFRKILLPSTLKLMQVLESQKPGDRDPMWMIEMYSQAAYTCYGTGESKAKDFMDKAMELQIQHFPNDIILHLKLLKYRVHVDVKSADGLNGKFKESPGSTILSMQKARSGDSSREASHLKGVFENCLSTLEKESKDEAIDPEKLSCVAQIGQLAFNVGLYSMAADCAQKALMINQLGGLYHAGVIADMIKHQLEIVMPPAWIVKTLENCLTLEDQEMKLCKHRIDKLKDMVVCLQSAQRLKASEIVEDICQIIWNMVLPLLEVRFYKKIEVVLSACCIALARIESNRHKLRVLFHLEFAKSQLESELLNNALDEIQKALALDYTLADEYLPQELRELLNKEEIERVVHGTERLDVVEVARDLDVQINPIHLKLKLKQDMYRVPATKEEEVLVLIEQVKDAKFASPSVQRNMLENVCAVLQAADKVGLESKKEEKDVKSIEDMGMKATMTRAHLWYEAAQLGIQFQFYDLARILSSKVLEFEWDVARPCHRHLLLQQAHANIYLAKCCAEDMKSMGMVPGFVDDSDAEPILKQEMKLPENYGTQRPKKHEFASLGSTLQSMMLNAVLRSQKIGLMLKEDTICINALSQMWNMHFEAIAIQTRTHVREDLGENCKEEDDVQGVEERKTASMICKSLFLAMVEVHKALWPSEDDKVRWAPKALDQRAHNILIHTAHSICRYFEMQDDNKTCVEIAQGTIKAISSRPEAILYAESLLTILARASEGNEPSEMPDNVIAKSIIWLEMCKLDKVESKVKEELVNKIKSALEEQESQVNVENQKDDGREDDKDIEESKNVFVLPALKGALKMEKEFSTILWSQLAVQAHNLKQPSLVCSAADRAAEAVVSLVSKDSLIMGTQLPLAKLHKISRDRWHWMTKSECAAGMSIFSLIDPKTQDRQKQDHIRSMALNRFMRATFYGAWCAVKTIEDPYDSIIEAVYAPTAHMLHATKRYWNAALPFMNDKVTRQLILKPTLVVHRQLTFVLKALSKYGVNSRQAVDPSFRVEIACLLLQCIFDQGMWDMGIKLSAEILSEIPQSLARPVWKARVLFLLKVGQDVEKDILNIGQDSGDYTLRAGLYCSLARASSNRAQQFQFYQKALQTIGESRNSSQSVEFLVEYAEWMYGNNLGRQSVQDELLTAADILIEPSLEHIIGNQEQDFGRPSPSVSSRNSRSSRGSRGSAASRSIKKMFGGSTKGGDKSHRSALSRKMSASIGKASGRRSSIASKTSRVSSTVAKTVSASEDNNSINAGHMAMLVRIYCMLATIASNKQHVIRLALIAQHFVLEIWKLSIDQVNLDIEQQQQQQEEEEEEEEKK
mmetsp:Transcript_9449/g.18469  ORF Transcript_9449/g.18469 Transcript_9449/m.18469 type:complete len:1470 (+) Transcript_9449:90-4499(+)